ncbi:hypothetical protein C8R44DRAFT_981699 [Mycena epipterygia]|nr:hypothetical protein C8R44DRAFT_981699 [Mycena epipterygia]
MLYTWAEVPYAAVASICVSGMMIYGTYCLLSVVPDADVISIGGIALLMILLFVTSLLVLSRVIHAVLSVFVIFALFFTTHSVWWSGTSDGILHISDPIAGSVIG